MSLHVIAGSMFSGKTTFLLHRLERQARAGKRVAVISKDTRFGGEVQTHRGQPLFPAIHRLHVPASALRDYTKAYDVFGVDEFQFEAPEAVPVILALAEVRPVIVAGLLTDFRQQPFETVVGLLHHADQVDFLTAVCHDCGSQDGIYNIRLGSSQERVQEGTDKDYKVVCRCCRRLLSP